MKPNLAPRPVRALLGFSVWGTIALLLRCGGDQFAAARTSSEGGTEASDASDELGSVVICNPCPADQPGDATGDVDSGAVDVTAAGEGSVDASDAGDVWEAGDGDGEVLEASACAPMGLACEGGCVSQDDIHNCGACGNDCTLLPNVSAAGLACGGGSCTYQCAAGFTDCIGAGTGCTSLQTDPNNCGNCGTLCAAACGAGVCVKVASIAAGGDTACALLSDNTVRCWGDNSYGETGIGANTPVSISTPSEAHSLTNALTIGVGQDYACALVDGGVECWGDNHCGQLGNGDTAIFRNDYSPASVPGSGTSIGLSAKVCHSCALRPGGAVDCWGDNTHGQLGNGATSSSASQIVTVSGLSGSAMAVATGEQHTCALISSGTVQCWGDNTYGQLGTGMTGGDSLTPITVAGLSGVGAIASGRNHVCALLSTGSVSCWGYNRSGQLGTGSVNDAAPYGVASPSQIPSLMAAQISAGADHTCVSGSDGSVMCWGDNSFGQLGDGSAASSSTPVVAIAGMQGVKAAPAQIAAGASFTCALVGTTKRGGLECWGSNASGQLGSAAAGTRQTSPTAVLW